MVLKKHACKQEDKIKKLATKLIRVLSDKKRLEVMTSSTGGGVSHAAGGGGGGRGGGHLMHHHHHPPRDIETEELIEDQQHRIRELERQVETQKEKLKVAKTQLLGVGAASKGVR